MMDLFLALSVLVLLTLLGLAVSIYKYLQKRPKVYAAGSELSMRSRAYGGARMTVRIEENNLDHICFTVLVQGDPGPQYRMPLSQFNELFEEVFDEPSK
jgi:hypothetical protein